MTDGKLRYVFNHRRSLVKKAVTDWISWLCFLVTLLASLYAFFPAIHVVVDKFSQLSWLLWVGVLFLLLGSVIVNWPRTKVTYVDSTTDIRVIIECCDILRQKGLKVIHTVDTFDTELDRIITPRSLHGAFLTMCKQRGVDLDNILESSLTHYQPISTDDTLPGRKQRYALGMVCPLKIHDDHYCFASFTRLQPDGSIQVTRHEYIDYLRNLWRNLSSPTIREEEVNVAVMGNRFVDLPAEFSTEQKIDLMIQSFFIAAREKACCRTLRICIHPNNVSEVDFEHYSTIIKHLAKRPVI